MALLRADGLRLHEIAQRYGVSGARVGQILQAHGGPDARQAAAGRRNRAEQDAAARVGELLAIWRSGEPLGAAAEALGLEPLACAATITRLASDADRTSRRANIAHARRGRPTYSDRDIHEALGYAAVRVGRTPSRKQYADVARELGFASLPTVLNRMGSWRAAVSAAGLTPRARSRSPTRRWTEEACWEALRTVVDEAGEIPSMQGYDRLAAGRVDLPSSATIRNRLGRWSAVITQLAADHDRRMSEAGVLAARN
ncbi:MAG TPA: hypothetical protein VG165_12395 [Solirubrobacteraceae bacterium]|jgi:hypothetical protein|nr:hypothetical protein [Solirubrobacteraceae bacterium]